MCILLRRLCKVHPVPAIIGESFLGRWQCEQNYRGVDTSCGGCRWGLVSGWEGEWVMEFPVLPPEINSVLMYSGAGSSPLLAAAAAWDGLAEELGSAAVSFGQVTSGLTAGVWQGAAAAAMAAAAAPYAGWLGSVAAAAEAVAGQARVVVGVFEAALAATVDPALVAANRARLVALAVSNLLGQNTPAIAAAEAEYELMWAADVAAMAGYHSGASAAAAALPAFSPPAQALGGGVGAFLTALFASPAKALSLNAGLGNVGAGRCAGQQADVGPTPQHRCRGR
ncbi:PPE family protein [Mycobacterium tuberculosis]|nr:PPE family protein [Mycobacterium tuberculosis]